MHRSLRRPVSLLLVIIIICSVMPWTTNTQGIMAAPALTPGTNDPISAAINPADLEGTTLPAGFIPNAGQSHKNFRFQTHNYGGTTFFTPGAVVFALPNPTEGSVTSSAAESDDPLPTNDKAWAARNRAMDHRRAQGGSVIPLTRVGLEFKHFNPAMVITGANTLNSPINYLIGESGAWKENVPTFASIEYQQLYRGIDLEWSNIDGVLKGTYTVAPTVDPAQIQWRYSGVQDISLNKAGDLVLTIRKGSRKHEAHILTEHAPIAWQTIGNSQVPVAVQFVIAADKSIGFELGAYDHTLPLVIDPSLIYSTYLGGVGNDWANDVTVDASGNIYIVGKTSSADFPTGSIPSPVAANDNVFVTKLDPTATNIIYTTFLGGANNEQGMSIKVDSNGNAYVTGWTSSTDFPTLNGYRSVNSGGNDTFVVKLNATGMLLYSTYFGGSNNDQSLSLEIDVNNNAYIAGATNSTNIATAGSYQAAAGGLNDVFVAKFNPALPGLSSLLFSTYVGGSANDWGYGIAVDNSGNSYVTGYTYSNNFPVAGGYQATLAGDRDAYLVKLNPTGTGLLYGTYLGGTGADEGIDVVIDSVQHVAITGGTYSTNFPTKIPLQAANGGSQDAFVASFGLTNNLLYFSTYLGGSASEKGTVIAANRDYPYQIAVGGSTSSSNFPLTTAMQVVRGGGIDGFVTQYSNNGTTMISSTYFGGSGDDWVDALKFDRAGNTVLAGATSSDNLPLINDRQGSRKGSNDAFVAAIDPGDNQVLTNNTTLWNQQLNPAIDEDVFYVSANAGQEISIKMARSYTGNALNGVVSLFSPDGNLLDTDDNTGGKGNPHLKDVVAPATGLYKVVVRDFSGTRTGTYDITASVANPLVPAPATPPAGQDVDPCPTGLTGSTPPPQIGGTTIENPDFTQGAIALLRTSYPANCDFSRGSQNLSLAISPASYTLNGTNVVNTSAAFTVPTLAQSLRFEYKVGDRNNANIQLPINVFAVETSPVGVETVTRIDDGSTTRSLNQGWQAAVLDIKAFQNKSIKLRFISHNVSQPYAEVKNLALHTEVPDWTPSNARLVRVVNDVEGRGSHLLIDGENQSATSPAFTLASNAQSLHFDYQVESLSGSTSKLPVFVDIMSGSTITPIDEGLTWHSGADGWQHAALNVKGFAGNSIKVRFRTNNVAQPRIRLDRITIKQETPGWSSSNSALVQVHNELAPQAEVSAPANIDFSQGQTALETPAINFDFARMRQNLGVTVSPATYALRGVNQSATSVAFVVPANAQTLRFNYLVGNTGATGTSKPLYVDVLSNTPLATVTQIDNGSLAGTLAQGWKNAILDVRPFAGQTIQLRFRNTNTDTPQADINAITINTEVPDWTPSYSPAAQIINNTSVYVWLNGVNQSLTSSAFTVPAAAQSLRFTYQAGDSVNLNTEKPVLVEVLSGNTYESATRIDGGLVSGSLNQGWKVAVLDLQAFQNKTIKVRFTNINTDNPVTRFDSLTLNVETPGWTSSNATNAQIKDSATTRAGSLVIDGTKTWATSAGFRVPDTAQNLVFDYKVGDRINGTLAKPLYVDIFSGDSFVTTTRIDGGTLQRTLGQGWFTASLDIRRFQSRTVKLRFSTHDTDAPQAWIDNISLSTGTSRLFSGPDDNINGNFLIINGENSTATSSAFLVPSSSAQSIRFRYKVGTHTNGNTSLPLQIHVSTNDFATSARIDQNLVTGAINDGWRVATINLSAFADQTVKLRFQNHNVGSPNTQIDHVALSSLRASLAAPVSVVGKAYMALPATNIPVDTPSVTANITINTATVYDEYLDMGGQVSYNGQTHAFNLSGDVYRSILADVSDKVARLSDSTGTFDVLHFAVRKDKGDISAYASLPAGPKLSLYLQRRGTRELVKLDITLTGDLHTTLSTLFTIPGQYDLAYDDEYWQTRAFQLNMSSNVEAFGGYGDPAKKSFRWIVRWEGTDCHIVEEIRFLLFTPDPGEVLQGTTQYMSQLSVVSLKTDGQVAPDQTWPASACDFHDANLAPMALGGKPAKTPQENNTTTNLDPNIISTQFVIGGNGQTGANAQGDMIIAVSFGGIGNFYTDDLSEGAKFLSAAVTLIDLGIKLKGSPLSVNDIAELVKGRPATQAAPTNEGMVNSALVHDNDYDPDTVIKNLRVPFAKATLAQEKNYIKADVSVTCKDQLQVSTDQPLLIRWHIPIVDTVHFKVIKQFDPYFDYIRYDSGPCNK